MNCQHQKYIKKHKIDWSDGCDNIDLSRENCLEESLEKIEFVDLWRELKIKIYGINYTI